MYHTHSHVAFQYSVQKALMARKKLLQQQVYVTHTDNGDDLKTPVRFRVFSTINYKG